MHLVLMYAVYWRDIVYYKKLIYKRDELSQITWLYILGYHNLQPRKQLKEKEGQHRGRGRCDKNTDGKHERIDIKLKLKETYG